MTYPKIEAARSLRTRIALEAGRQWEVLFLSSKTSLAQAHLFVGLGENTFGP